jgi:hypothetical protein
MIYILANQVTYLSFQARTANHSTSFCIPAFKYTEKRGKEVITPALYLRVRGLKPLPKDTLS